MRLLFKIDTADYPEGGREYVMPSARAVIIRGGGSLWCTAVNMTTVNFPAADGGAQSLDEYEADEGFTLEWVDPLLAAAVNRERDRGQKDMNMTEREARVLEVPMGEGYFKHLRRLVAIKAIKSPIWVDFGSLRWYS